MYCTSTCHEPDISQKFWNICVVNVLCDGRDNLGHVDASMMRMKRIERTEKKNNLNTKIEKNDFILDILTSGP